MNQHFSERIKISVSLENPNNSDTPPEIAVAEDCFIIARALFQILVMTGGYGGGAMIDDRIQPFEAIHEIALLGVIFTDIAFNSLDEYGIRTFHENNSGGEK